MIFIYSIFPNKKIAKRVGERLVRKRLAACVNIFPMDLIYSWREKIVKEKGFAVIIKTRKENFKKIEKFIGLNGRNDFQIIKTFWKPEIKVCKTENREEEKKPSPERHDRIRLKSEK